MTVRRMRITHVNTTVHGGAARAAVRLCDGLRRAGHESLLFTLRRGAPQPMALHYTPPDGLLATLNRRRRRQQIARDLAPYRATRPAGFEAFSDDRSEHAARHVLAQVPACDVVHLHWVSGFVDVADFLDRAGATGRPVVWTVHDLNPITGGCHYTGGCDRFTGECGACPQLGSERFEDLSRAVHRRKERAFVSANVTPVACSDWTAGQIKRSAITAGLPVHTIPLGLDTDVFAPRDRAAARSILGLPPTAVVVMFVADSLTNRRKGFGLLAEALAGLRDVPDILLLSVGGDAPASIGGLGQHHLGYVTDDRLLAAAYSAADVFVIPSLEEAFGQTALEAAACGTPVVGFAVGGIPEVVRHDETGLLVPPGDVPALRAAIARLATDAALRRRTSTAARTMVLGKFTLAHMAGAYANLYASLVRQPRADANTPPQRESP